MYFHLHRRTNGEGKGAVPSPPPSPREFESLNDNTRQMRLIPLVLTYSVLYLTSSFILLECVEKVKHFSMHASSSMLKNTVSQTSSNHKEKINASSTNM